MEAQAAFGDAVQGEVASLNIRRTEIVEAVQSELASLHSSSNLATVCAGVERHEAAAAVQIYRGSQIECSSTQDYSERVLRRIAMACRLTLTASGPDRFQGALDRGERLGFGAVASCVGAL